MAVTTIDRTHTMPPDLDRHDPPVAHRLPELVQALTGCSIELAELVIDDPFPTGTVAPEAIDAVAEALVRLRRR